ncbi:MAG: tetratricopeptide repeat protein [Chitinophagaceae bacterium]|nr:tetratricopeptide repeat protein [Chitinophagaceae bacterium]
MQEINNNTAQNRIQRLTQMLQEMPGDCFLLHALGLEYQKMGELQLAIESFQRVLAINEKYIGTYYHLGKTLEMQGEPESAIAVYEKGILIARELNDRHAMNELQMVLDELTD